MRFGRSSTQVSTRGTTLMHSARFVRKLGFLLVLSHAGFAIGCGSDGQSGTGETQAAAAVKTEVRNSRKELKTAREGEFKRQTAAAKQVQKKEGQ